jgi:DNA-binding SARP family transcriptional activator
MSLSIWLLGKPSINKDGALASPRGRKAWALLAYLIRAQAPATREQLASLLFSDADDPLRALRWNLTELRQVLDHREAFKGERIEISLPPGTFVDVRAVTTGTWMEAVELPGLGRDLLEGMSFSSSPAFEAWLLTERRHLAASSAGILREAALARLAAGDAEKALGFARKLIELDPLDENFQALLIRSLAAAGHRDAAVEQLAACTELFRRELGVSPGPGVRSALETPVGSTTLSAATGRAAARAQLDAGRAAIDAGAVEAGLQCLRRAAAEAHSCGDSEMKAEALFSLGSALVHAARGRDEEAAAALHECIALAKGTGVSPIAASAYRELGYVEMLRGRYERAESWLEQALRLAVDDQAETAKILAVMGLCQSDTARYADAIETLTSSAELAEAVGAAKQAAWSLAYLGRAHLLREEPVVASAHLTRSLEIAREQAWTPFIPLPESLLADVALLEGRVDEAAEAYEHAFALGCQVGDPCWEGLGARGLGLVAAARGQFQTASERLQEARTRCVRLPDAYLWIEAYSIDALCSVGVAQGAPESIAWIEDLESLAARTGMREFVARAYLHRRDLGDNDALEGARLLAAEIDNPSLHRLIESAETRLGV